MMNWIHDYQLFLFDFDGLLVNTEEIHYLAYKRMFADRGFNLHWDFDYYCRLAHYSSDGLRKEIYIQFPDLVSQEPSWDVLYGEKKAAIIKLLNEGAVHPMVGVEKLLLALQKADITRCVVTHSPAELIEVVRKKNPILNTIPHWLTREQYTHPKPHSECYIKAIEKWAKPEDRVIGFEDTPRGLTALMGTRAEAVLITPIKYPEIPNFVRDGAKYYPSFEAISDL